MASADQSNSTVSLAKVYNSLNGRVFQVIRGPVVVLIDRRLGFKRKRLMISNFLTSSVRSLHEISDLGLDIIHQDPGLRFPCNNRTDEVNKRYGQLSRNPSCHVLQ